MKKFPVVFALLMAVSLVVSSCDKEWPEEPLCTCGGEIGGWDDPKDTTIVHRSDTTGGFDVSVSQWGDTITHDIYL